MRNKKNIIMIVMCIAVFVMAVGYAVLSTNLNIGATGNINTTWGISITNITSTITGTAVNITDPTYTGVNATFNAGFYKPGDKVTYTVTVSNTGDIDAIISDVIINTTGSSDIIYTVEGLQKNAKLSKKTNVTFKIVAEFDVNSTAIPVISEKTINMVLVVMQDSGTNPTPIAPEITDKTTQYGIMYVANGGIGLMNGTVCQVGQSCVIATNTFTKEGYKFKGWSTTPSGDIEYTNGQTVTDLTTKGKTQVLYAVWENVQLVYHIMNDNTAYADNVSSLYVTNSTGIDFSQISSDTNGKGLYYTSTNTENNQRTYYYRGAVENNYVKFGKDSSGNDILWRIVRINEDGSIRLITQNTVGNSKFNINSDDNAYVGYMYGSTDQSGDNAYNLTHSNDNPSTIKTYLDELYNSNLSSYSSYFADAGFCNDRSVAPSAWLWNSIDTSLGYAKNATIYGADRRLTNTADWTVKENAQPQFKCPNEVRDLFTTRTSTKGNHSLANPIGLLTADEVAFAGGVYGKANTSMYLTNSSYYFTMSPFFFDDRDSIAYAWSVYEDGTLSASAVYLEDGVCPVINLKSTVALSTELPTGCTKLDGTEACPYIIDTNS